MRRRGWARSCGVWTGSSRATSGWPTRELLHLYAQRAPLLKARDVARDNLTIVENRYKNGDALIIEFLDSQIDLEGAERLLADLTAQLQLAWLELDASLGKIVGASS